MNYIYKLRPAQNALLRRLGRPQHKIKRCWALPTWAAGRIERKALERYARFRIQYYPGIQPATFCVIRKIGITKYPDKRLAHINNDWRSGRTEYVEINRLRSIALTLYVFRLWFFYTVFIPALIISIFTISALLFVIL